MNISTYCRVSAIVFTAAALAHLARLIYGASVVIDGQTIPMLASWLGLIIPGGLAFWGFRGSRGAG